MIRINLLPDVLRKKESTPIGQLLGLVGAIVAVGAIWMVNYTYFSVTIPGLRDDRQRLEAQKAALTAQVQELQTLNAEIDKLNTYVTAVKTLYKQRTVWAKVLSDLKHIVNFDPTMSGYNFETRYLWLNKLEGRGKSITLSGYATAANRVGAMQLPRRLLENIQSFTPGRPPEQEMEVQLEGDLRQAIQEYDVLRRDNPDLPLQGPKELELKQRLEEVKGARSGGVAMKPFTDILIPGSVQLGGITWTNAPRPTKRQDELQEVFPTEAWQFNVTFNLK